MIMFYEHKIAHKTLSSTMSPELLARTAPEQAGKAFTIYPQSKEEMAQIAKDLDKLIREHNLTTNTSHITGDNNLGNSGRLFYRYEFPSGNLKDKIYTPNERAPYDGNRGEGQYLAYDMTPADDPWLNFDPSVPDAEPAKIPSAEYIHVEHNLTLQQFPETGTLSKNASYELDMNNLPQFTLANRVTLDLNEPSIKSKITQLQPGQKLTIGRAGDIQIDDITNYVSRKHLEIENVNGQIVIRDISSGGTKLASKMMT